MLLCIMALRLILVWYIPDRIKCCFVSYLFCMKSHRYTVHVESFCGYCDLKSCIFSKDKNFTWRTVREK